MAEKKTAPKKRAAKKTIKREGWGVPGLSWTPGTVDDPFGHVQRVLAALGPHGAVQEALRLAKADERATDDITVVVVRRDA